MTVNLDSEIVGTRYDAKSGDCFYTIERGGKRWTVQVHESDFAKLGPVDATKQQRRNYLANVLERAMGGPPDKDAA